MVFDDYPTLKKMIDDEDADITEDHVIVLRNAGPKGGPGMPEWGMVPIPVKLLKQGVRDMLRVSDARMSGTSYGACALACRARGVHRRQSGAGAHRRHHHDRRAEPTGSTWR